MDYNFQGKILWKQAKYVEGYNVVINKFKGVERRLVDSLSSLEKVRVE